MPVQLFENQLGYSSQEVLNNSVIGLEYKFANAIRKLTQYRPPQVVFIQGNDELSPVETADMRNTLTSLEYEVKDLDLSRSYYIPERADIIIIAKPRMAFTEKDKFKIDQYIMRGGKALWLVDGTNATMDSLRLSPTGQFVLGNDFNLDDMLFKYGVRINTDVLQDINLCNPIPLMTNSGSPQLYPWYYFPLLISDNNHAIIKNLDPVASFFASSIDTIKNPGVKYIEKSRASKMIVISDGDIIRNELKSDTLTYPLGYYIFTKQQFANKSFILNCIEFLIDDSGILESRNKEVKLRMLNSVKVEDEKLKWQLVNIAVPIVLIILFGFAFNAYRKKKYAA